MTEAGYRLGRRIWIMGPPGAGKTTLASELRRQLALPYHELDQLFWLPGWKRTDERDFQEAVARIAHSDGWIIDGQYDQVHPTLSSTADTLIWLDTGFRVVFGRVVSRSVRRLVRGAELWNGNRETPVKIAGLLMWTARTYSGVRRRNQQLFQRLSAQGVLCLRVRTTDEWHRLLRDGS